MKYIELFYLQFVNNTLVVKRNRMKIVIPLSGALVGRNKGGW